MNRFLLLLAIIVWLGFLKQEQLQKFWHKQAQPYLVQHNILNREAFFTLMVTAFFLNILVPVCIGLWRPVYLREEAG